MLGYGHVLAQAGYGVILWDFDGHGANPRPLDREGERFAAKYCHSL
jgi:alpha-beta hydrolase superfamily lysophospholipase